MSNSSEKIDEPAPPIASLKPGSHHSGDAYNAEKGIPTEAGDVIVVGGLGAFGICHDVFLLNV